MSFINRLTGVIARQVADKVIVNAVFVWLEKSASLSENKYDDMLSVLYPKLKELALDQAEKINKED